MALSSRISTCEQASPGEISGPELTDSPNRTDSPQKSSPGMPTRKNKRKLSEPRRRNDFSMKRRCPGSPGSVSDHSVGSDGPDRIIKEDPPETPTDPGFTTDQGDSSQSVPGKGGAPHNFSERVNCMVPTLYFPAGLGRSPEAFGIPVPYDSSGNLPFDSGLRQPMGHPSLPIHGMYPSSLNDDCVDDEEEMDDDGSPPDRNGKRPRKNYKNMTRERRIEANARERTRVHTISAAFESLRRAVPSYSYNQKLSKLAILRIACTYIMALGRLADLDYSTDGTKMDFPDCVDLCTRTIQTEGRARRRH